MNEGCSNVSNASRGVGGNKCDSPILYVLRNGLKSVTEGGGSQNLGIWRYVRLSDPMYNQ